MHPYRNDGSEIEAVEYGDTWMHVKFKKYGTFKCCCPSVALHHIEEMKRCADAEAGLNTYINKYRDEIYYKGRRLS